MSVDEKMGKLLLVSTAIHAMIGYCQSLKAGTVITEEYITRMNAYYIPQLEAAIATMGDSCPNSEETSGVSGGCTPSPTTPDNSIEARIAWAKEHGSEISVVDDKEIHKQAAENALRAYVAGEHNCRYKEALDTAHEVFGAECDQMQARLRTTEPSEDLLLQRFQDGKRLGVIETEDRLREPVSVSLEKCADIMSKAMGWDYDYPPTLAYKVAKAVLDAAGVKYVD